ncbi:MAG: hypothetical protein ACPG4X_21235 [Pikeienuella sp.]
MNGTMTAAAAGVSALFGFSLVYTTEDIVRPSYALPPAIQVNEIIIRADGSTIYDRDVLEAPVWMAWSGQVLDDNNEIVCSGGGVFEYKLSSIRHTDKTVDWLIEGDCSGIEAGMRFSFTWTPIGPDYAPVRYPAEGYGIITE